MLEKITKVDTKKDVMADFVLLSDIHASKSTDYNWLYQAAKRIKNRDVTAVIVLGDSLNNGLDLESAKRLSDVYYEFGKVAPVIMINGNHDLVTPKQTDKGERWFYIRKPEDVEILEKILAMFNELPNVNLLRNNDLLLPGGIRVLGLDIDVAYYSNEFKNQAMLYETFISYFNDALDKRDYNVFLSHSPLNLMDPIFRENFHVFDNIDLQLAGHMHNGLLPHYLSWIFPGDVGLIGKKNGKLFLFRI